MHCIFLIFIYLTGELLSDQQYEVKVSEVVEVELFQDPVCVYGFWFDRSDRFNTYFPWMKHKTIMQSRSVWETRFQFCRSCLHEVDCSGRRGHTSHCVRGNAAQHADELSQDWNRLERTIYMMGNRGGETICNSGYIFNTCLIVWAQQHSIKIHWGKQFKKKRRRNTQVTLLRSPSSWLKRVYRAVTVSKLVGTSEGNVLWVGWCMFHSSLCVCACVCCKLQQRQQTVSPLTPNQY